MPRSLCNTLPILAIFLAPVFLNAQDANGKIAGVITDPSGGVVPQAKIIVTNVGTKIGKETTTNSEGFYQIQLLPIGNYQVAVEAPGFSKMVSATTALDINQTLRVDLKIQIGQIRDVVNVDSHGSTVETQNTAVGGTVVGQAIYELPLNGRNTLDLLATQPGVTPTNPGNAGAGGYSIGGGRTDSVTYLLDGGLNNDLLTNGVVVNPNPDAVAEFRVLESTYGAEYGRNAGGIVSIVTKSGTNSPHGTFYDYARNEYFNANQFFNNQQGLPRPILKRQQYGATFGGPLVIPHIVDGRNKLFFFFSYQGQRQSQLQLAARTQTYTPAEAQGDFSALGTGDANPVAQFLLNNPYYQSNPTLASQGIIDPTKIDPAAQAYFKNGLIPTSPSGFLFPQAPALNNANEYLGKIDFNATSRDLISGTFATRDGYSTSPFSNATVTGYTAASYTQMASATVSYLHTFTASLFNEFRANAVRYTPTARVPTTQLPGPAELGIATTPDKTTGPPLLYFYDAGTIGFDPTGPTSYRNTTYSLYDNVSWTKGAHNLKFGFFFSPYQNNSNYGFYLNGIFYFYGPATGVGSGVGLADFMLGLPDYYFQGPQALSNIRSHQYAGYVQDEWHVTKRLTLNLGIRYEYSQPKYDTQGRTFSFVPGAQSTRFVNAPPDLVYPGDAGAPRGVNFPDKNDWAPRFGFAWDVFGNAKTSIRGGFGMFYDVLKGEDNLQFNGAPPFYTQSSFGFNPPTDAAGNRLPYASNPGFLSNPFGTNSSGTPNGFPSRPPASTVSYAPFLPLSSNSAIYLVDPHLRTPYVFQYNLNLQQQLVSGMVLDIAYIGSSSHKLTSLVDINPFPLGSDTRIYNPDSSNSIYGSLRQFQNISKASYNAMQVSVTRRFGNSKLGNAFFTFAYTWSHEIDNVSGFQQFTSAVPYYNHDAFRASGDTDIRNALTFSGGWDLPFDRLWERGPKLLTKGWSLYPIVTWRTGFPLDVLASLATNGSDPGPAGDGAAGLVRADLVQPTIATYNARNTQTINGITGNYFFNPNALSNARLIALDQASQVDPASLVGQFTYGTLGRNALRGPSFINTDLSIAKHFFLFNEKLDCELRGDAFDLFNHANFGNPGTTIGNANFGQVSTTIGQGGSTAEGFRILQLALHFRF